MKLSRIPLTERPKVPFLFFVQKIKEFKDSVPNQPKRTIKSPKEMGREDAKKIYIKRNYKKEDHFFLFFFIPGAKSRLNARYSPMGRRSAMISHGRKAVADG